MITPTSGELAGLGTGEAVVPLHPVSRTAREAIRRRLTGTQRKAGPSTPSIGHADLLAGVGSLQTGTATSCADG